MFGPWAEVDAPTLVVVLPGGGGWPISPIRPPQGLGYVLGGDSGTP